jgi:ribose/xylose/arabinose/galactoside ABC-type transport system permease subunit
MSITLSPKPLEPAALRAPHFALRALTGPVVGLIAVLTLFIVLIGFKGELRVFLSLGNLQVLLHEATIPAIVALGMLLVIISGGIDLSVGSVIALVTVVTMQAYIRLYHYYGSERMWLASLAAIAAGVGVGGLCGLANGLIITRLRVTPFVATLGMLGIARGLAVWLAERRQVIFPGESRPGWVDVLSQVKPGYTETSMVAGQMVKVDYPAWYFFNPGFWTMVGLAALVAVLLRSTILGRYCYAIGSNEATARLCGVPVQRNKVIIYTLAGLLTGWAGILSLAHLGAGDPSAGETLELQVIAAVVIGGAALTGGQGTVVGALLGVMILQVLGNGVNTFEVPVEVQYILMGVIIIANTALSGWQRRESQ